MKKNAPTIGRGVRMNQVSRKTDSIRTRTGLQHVSTFARAALAQLKSGAR